MRATRALLIAAIGLSAACATAANPRPVQRDMTDLMVEIRNDHWLPMRVWAVWDHARIYLGEIRPEGRYVYHIPGSTLAFRGDCRLFAEAMGDAEEVTTRPIDRTAHHVRWRLERHLLSSHALVF